jgi:fatty-acid peroxygenase
MIDASGAVGRRHWRGRKARKQAERWLSELVRQFRNKEMEVVPGSIFHQFAIHRDLDSQLPDIRIVAVELLNLIRPIVAIARYIVFVAKALHDYPLYLKQLKDGRTSCTIISYRKSGAIIPFFRLLLQKLKNRLNGKGLILKRGTGYCLICMQPIICLTHGKMPVFSDPNAFKRGMEVRIA